MDCPQQVFSGDLHFSVRRYNTSLNSLHELSTGPDLLPSPVSNSSQFRFRYVSIHELSADFQPLRYKRYTSVLPTHLVVRSGCSSSFQNYSGVSHVLKMIKLLVVSGGVYGLRSITACYVICLRSVWGFQLNPTRCRSNFVCKRLQYEYNL